MQRAPAARNALLIPTPPPIRKTSLRQLDSGRGRLLRLLLEPIQAQQNLSAAAFLREQDAVDDPIAVHSDLPDVAVKMTGGSQAPIANLLHAGEHSRRVGIGELVDELLDRAAPRRGLIVAPAPPDRRRLTGGEAGLLPVALRWSHRTSLCSASGRALLVSRTGPNPGPRGSKNAKRPVFTGRKRTPGQGLEPQSPGPEPGVTANWTIPDSVFAEKNSQLGLGALPICRPLNACLRAPRKRRHARWGRSRR